MKKLFTFLTLVLFAMTVQAQTADDTYLDIAKYATIESAGYKTDAVDELISFDQENRILTISAFGAYQSAGTQKWITTDGSGSTSATWEAPEGSVFKGSAYYHTNTTAKASTVHSTRATFMKVTNCSKIEALVLSNGTSDTKAVVVEIYEEGVETPVYSATDKSKTNVILGKDGLDPQKVYTLKVSGTGTSNSRFFEAAFTLAQTSLVTASVDNWNTLFGTNYDGAVSNVNELSGAVTGTPINVTYAKNGGSMYVKDGQIRIYAQTVITIASSPEKLIKKVVVEHSTSGSIFLKSTDELYDKDTKTWTGSNNVVVLQRGDEGTTGNVQMTHLEITYDNGEVTKVPLAPIFTFGKKSVNTIIGEEFVGQLVKSNAENAPAYSSTNTDVATVDAATGVVTVAAPGTTIIKAVVEASENNLAAEASYVLNVAPEGTIFYAPMAKGLDGFTTDAPNVWSYNSQYNCAYGNAYNKGVVGPFDLVSPVIDLTDKQNAVLTFSHAGKFFTTVADEAQLLVKLEADGAEWTPVAIPNHVTNENFDWVESGNIDLSAYNNEKIRIAFRYSNTEANKGGTWEIKNVVVAAKAATPTVEHLYLLGGNADWNFKDNVELPFDEEAQAFKYEIETENDHFFSFADKNDCASWDELNGDHRWAYVPRSSGDFAPELDVEYALTKVEGTFMLHAGKYTVTVTKDMKMTVTGEVTPILPAYIDYPTTAAGITIGGSTEMDAVVKIHNNTDEVKGIKFANGYTTEGALSGNYATIEIDGGFKAGDVISIAGAFNNTDETKTAAVDIFTLDETDAPVVLFTTQPFVNGRVSPDDPAVEKFTLEADYDKLYLGRNGNTGTFVTLLKTERVAPTVEHLYLLGGNQDWTWANNAELPFDETAQAWTYEVNSPEGEHFFAFADKNDCASWDELNGSHRWALEAGDIVPEINAEYALTKVNGTVKLPAGQYTVTVTKDMKMTVKAITDGIRSIENSELRMKNSDYYNLAGQRVGKDYKGIVIVNGKKVLVK